ncbi:MAG: hypothetical protein II920_07140, partial [Clostridia bacterium]|nr:hypothetical protein [Clostridia bacterium]
MNESFKQLKLSRQAATRGNIAAGARHSLVLRKDGTVTAAGDDSFGQCRTSQWFGVIQVAAGASHSVGLCSDGSVVAAGDNSQGQCDVSAWRGIKAIAAGA